MIGHGNADPGASAAPPACAAPSFWVGHRRCSWPGLAVLGYVGWQFFGTNIVAERKQQTRSSERPRRRGAPGRRGATGRATGRASSHGAEALIRIPRFGHDYVMPVQRGRLATTCWPRASATSGHGRPGGRATTRWPRTGSPTASRCATCRQLRPGDQVHRRDPRQRPTPTARHRPQRPGRRLPRPLGGRPGSRPTPTRGVEPVAATRAEADHAHHLRRAVPHRQPDDRLRPPGPSDEAEWSGRRTGNRGPGRLATPRRVRRHERLHDRAPGP